MNYTFNISNLEILNRLIFDSGFDFHEMMENQKREEFQIKLERRSFENVIRTKGLLGTRTRFTGRLSLLRISGFDNLEITGVQERFKDNHFLSQIIENDKNEIELASNFGLVIKLEPQRDFKIELLDLGKSSYGKGSLMGKKGFTESEWKEYLEEKKYLPQHWS